MLRLIFVVAIVASETRERMLAEDCEEAYERWLESHESQSTADYETRMQHFCDNLNKPAPARKSSKSARFEVWTSPLADMDHEEFYEFYHLRENAKFLAADMAEREQKGVRTRALQEIPSAHDWADHFVIQPVQNQGGCGSCWSFSIVGCSEGAAAAIHGVNWKLAESFVLDCTYNHGGCAGGNMPRVMKEIMDNDLTIPLHSDGHPYEARDRSDAERAEICDVSYDQGVKLMPFTPNQQVHSVQGEEAMRESLYLYGPIQVAIDASPLPMYHDYIISGNECNWNQLNHAVVLTAYSEEFYTIKNSWGTGWGDNGYFKIEANSNVAGGCIGIGRWVNACIVDVIEGSPDPVDCVGSWGEWGACSATCDKGFQSRTYTISTPAAHGGAVCPETNGATETRTCQVSECEEEEEDDEPIDCSLFDKKTCKKDITGSCAYRQRKCQPISNVIISMTSRKADQWCKIFSEPSTEKFCPGLDENSCQEKFNGVKVCRWKKGKCEDRKVMKLFNQANADEQRTVQGTLCGSRVLSLETSTNIVV